MIFNHNDFWVQLDFCKCPLILHMNVNWFMVIGVEEKPNTKYE